MKLKIANEGTKDRASFAQSRRGEKRVIATKKRKHATGELVPKKKGSIGS